MGTFAHYYGNVKIPEEKLPELTQRMLTMLEQGGIMKHERVSLFGKELGLLYSVDLDEDGRAVFCYSYFDDDFWEDAAYNSKTGKVSSNKIGWGDFSSNVLAAYVLMELYSEEYGLVAVGDSLYPGAWKVIGWINHLFEEQFKNVRLMDAWKVYRLLKKFDFYDTFEGMDYLKSLSLSPSYTIYAMLGTIRYLTVMYPEIVRSAADDKTALYQVLADNSEDSDGRLVVKMTENLSEIAINRYLEQTSCPKLREASDYMKTSEWKKLYRKYPSNNQHIGFCGLTEVCASSLECLRDLERESKEEQLRYLKKILLNHEAFYPEQDSFYYPFWFASYLLPQEATLKVISDVYGLDFWELMQELEDCVDEKSEDWHEEYLKNCDISEPVRKISLGEMLHFEERGLSDDDRAYFWRPDGDVRFSDEMYRWMETLKAELLEIEGEDGGLIEGKDFIKVFMEILEEANEIFSRIYFFRDAFYEFLTHADHRRVQAAIILLKRLVERNRNIFFESETSRFSWVSGGYNQYHPARLEVKRYIAILGNPLLRKIQFGF